jgi:cytoskeletal protein CcmA (bactofilin family)
MLIGGKGLGEKLLRNRKGVAFITVLALILILAIVCVFFLSFAVQALHSSTKTSEMVIAFHLADAGVSKCMWELATNYNQSAQTLRSTGQYSEDPSTDPSDQFDVGYFKFTVKMLNPSQPPPGPYFAELISTGYSKRGEIQTLRALLKLFYGYHHLRILDFAMYSDKRLDLVGSSWIKGDVGSNGDINFTGNASVYTLTLTLQTTNPIPANVLWVTVQGLQVPAYIDYDGDGVPETPYALDTNLDGVADAVVKDQNGVPLLYDSNGDGKVDSVKSTGPFIYYVDTNRDGIADSPSGNVFSGGDVSYGGNNTINGGVFENQPKEPLPVIDLNYYRSIATEYYPGDKTFAGNITLNGVIFVDGSVSISGNISGQGMIVARNGIKVTGDVVYQSKSDFLALITPNVIKVAGNVRVDGLLYSHNVQLPTEVDLLGNVEINGAVIGDNIITKGNVQITYDPRIREISLPLPGATMANAVYLLAWQEK